MTNAPIDGNHHKGLLAADSVTGDPKPLASTDVNGDPALNVYVVADDTSSSASLTERYDYSSSTVIYTGTAPLGTATSSAAWKITKYDLNSSSAASGKVKTAGVWDDRATETYS